MIPELPYSLHDRYTSIAIAWTVILIPPIFINLGLFYGLWYGTQLDRVLVLTVPTGVLGIFTVIAIIERIWKLIQPSPQFRPLNSPRYALDIFQWGYFGALILISTLISSALARGDVDNDSHELQIRLISLPTSLLMFFLATLTLLSLIFNALAIPLPFRFGSLEAGNVIRPAIYYIVEDIVAVDGNGGLEHREAWTKRYESSDVFRKMIWRLSVVWMLAFFVLGGVFSVMVWKLRWEAVYAVGWAGPFPLAGAVAGWTIWYVKRCLRREMEVKELGEADAYGQNGGISKAREDERAPLLGSRV